MEPSLETQAMTAIFSFPDSSNSKTEYVFLRHTHAQIKPTWLTTQFATDPMQSSTASTHRTQAKHQHSQVLSSTQDGRDSRSLVQADTQLQAHQHTHICGCSKHRHRLSTFNTTTQIPNHPNPLHGSPTHCPEQLEV